MKGRDGFGSWRRVGALVLSFTLLTAFAACSDDDEQGGAADATDATDDASAAGEDGGQVLRIGVIAPLDDGLTSFGHGIENSVQLAVDQANEAEAIEGWEIEVAAEDDSSEPELGAEAAETVAADDSVIGVVGTYNSGVAAEVAPILNDAGIAMITPGNTDATLTLGEDRENPVRPFENYFRMVSSDAHQGPFLATYAAEDLGAATVAIVSLDQPVSRGLADDFSAAFTEAGGEIVSDTTVPEDTTDFGDAVTEITPLAPDLLFFGGEYEAAAAFRTAAADIDAPLMGGDGIKDDIYIEQGGLDGDIASTVGTPVEDLESAADYAEDYEAAGFEDPPTDFGPYAYDAANLLIDAAATALEDEDSVTADVRAAIIAEVQSTDTEGVTGQLGFDEFGDPVVNVFTLYEVTDGEWVAVLTEEVD